MKKIFYILTICLLTSCTEKIAKEYSETANLIKTAYDRDEHDFNSLIQDSAFVNMLSIYEGYAEILKANFSYCDIKRGYDEANYRIYYVLTARPDALEVGDYAKITFNTYNSPDSKMIHCELGVCELQLNGRLVENNGYWDLGNWTAEYLEDEFGQVNYDKVSCLKLKNNPYDITFHGKVWSFKTKRPYDVKRLILKDEYGFKYSFNAIGSQTGRIYIEGINEQELYLSDLFDAKHFLTLSFVDENNTSIDHFNLENNEGGKFNGAFLRLVYKNKAFNR